MKNKGTFDISFGGKIVGRGHHDETGRLIITESSPELDRMMVPAEEAFSIRAVIPPQKDKRIHWKIK